MSKSSKAKRDKKKKSGKRLKNRPRRYVGELHGYVAPTYRNAQNGRLKTALASTNRNEQNGQLTEEILQSIMDEQDRRLQRSINMARGIFVIEARP